MNITKSRLLSWVSNTCPTCKTKQELGSMADVYKVTTPPAQNFKDSMKQIALSPLYCSIECLEIGEAT